MVVANDGSLRRRNAGEVAGPLGVVRLAVGEDLHHQASLMLEKYGMLTKAPNTGLPIQSPYLPIVNKQAAIMLKAAEQLGFSPVSRSRVQLVGELSRQDDDPRARLRD